jgi:hypothetical protein
MDQEIRNQRGNIGVRSAIAASGALLRHTVVLSVGIKVAFETVAPATKKTLNGKDDCRHA